MGSVGVGEWSQEGNRRRGSVEREMFNEGSRISYMVEYEKG